MTRTTYTIALVALLILVPFSTIAVADAATTTSGGTAGSNGTVYYGDMSGVVRAVDRSDGTVQWTFNTGDTEVRGVVAAGGHVYAATRTGTSDGAIYKLDMNDGTQHWKWNDSTDGLMGPVAVNGTIYAASQDGNVYAVNDDGTTKWTFSGATDQYVSTPHVSNNTVFVGNDDGGMRAIDAADGTQRWNASAGDDRVRASPVHYKGNVYFGTVDNGYIYAINESTGSTEWTYNSINGVINYGVSVFDGKIYYGGDRYAEAVHAKNGTLAWRYDSGTGSIRTSVTNTNDTLYFGDHSGTVYALEEDTGNERWTYATGDTEMFGNPTVSEGTLLIGSDTKIHAFDADTGTHLWSNADGDVRRIAVASPDSDKTDGSMTSLGTLWHNGIWTSDGEDGFSSEPGTSDSTETPGYINLSVQTFIQYNESIPYTVYHVDGGERTDVTADATVTSDNSSAIAVNETTHELVSQRVNNSATITAEYGGLTETVNVSTADVALDNIEFLPESYYPVATVLDTDIQWIFFAVLVGSIVARVGDNAIVGIGVIQLLIVMGWAINWLSGGILMAGVFYAILSGLILSDN